MKSLINGISRVCLNHALGLLLIRVITGLIFFAHGWMKVQNMAGTEAFFITLGVAAFWAPVVAWLEVIGGIGLVLGVFTRAWGVALGVIMVFAIFLLGFERNASTYQFEALLAATSFGLALLGSGRYSLFPMECRSCSGMLCHPDDANCTRRNA